jgi:hypothetical protein
MEAQKAVQKVLAINGLVRKKRINAEENAAEEIRACRALE